MNIDEAKRFLRDIILDPKTNVESVNRATLALRELQPEPRIIDWQKVVDNRLPVMVWGSSDPENAYLAFLRGYDGHENEYPFRVGKLWKECASLETGQWVFNSSGENVWPSGVRFEVWTRAGTIQEVASGNLSSLDWKKIVLASRAVGLEDGWSYGGGQ